MDHVLATLPKPTTGHHKHPKSYSQATVLQQKLADAIASCHADLTHVEDREVRARIGSALASMVRGWDILEERKRILRGRPLPGHLRPDLPASQRKQTKRVALLATMADEPPQPSTNPPPVDQPKESSSAS